MDGPDYQVIDHTADLALRVRARSLVGLMTGAAEAMLSEMFAGYVPRPRATGESITIDVDGVDPESLLVNLCNEILYRVDVYREVPTHMTVTDLQPCRVIVKARALPAGSGLQQLREIKAATYHGLVVEQGPGGTWDATIVFDV